MGEDQRSPRRRTSRAQIQQPAISAHPGFAGDRNRVDYMIGNFDDAAVRLDQAAIDITKRLIAMQHVIDQIGRLDGFHLTITRQELDDIADGMRFISRRVRDLASGV
jgi:hypothetical protein